MVADTNCMFAKGVTACSSWYGVMTANTHDVHKLAECAPGRLSQMDRDHDHDTSMRCRKLLSSDAFNPPL